MQTAGGLQSFCGFKLLPCSVTTKKVKGRVSANMFQNYTKGGKHLAETQLEHLIDGRIYSNLFHCSSFFTQTINVRGFLLQFWICQLSFLVLIMFCFQSSPRFRLMIVRTCHLSSSLSSLYLSIWFSLLQCKVICFITFVASQFLSHLNVLIKC